MSIQGLVNLVGLQCLGQVGAQVLRNLLRKLYTLITPYMYEDNGRVHVLHGQRQQLGR